LAGFNVWQAIHCGQALGCVDEYWAQFWVISYTDGYERRALLGQTIKYFFESKINYATLNYLATFNALAILLFIYFSYFNNFTKSKYWILPLLIILSGPTTTVLFEVLGDPLHISFLIVLLYSMVAYSSRKTFSLISGLISSVLVVLIHEASILLFLPSIYLIYCITQDTRFDFWKVLFAIVLLSTCFSLAFNNQLATQHTLGIISRDGSTIYPRNDALLSFTSLLKHEFYSYFGSINDFAIFLIKIIRVSLWPIGAILILINILGDKELLKIFLVLLIASLPLYIVAHDWGRFEIYTLLISIYISGLWSTKENRDTLKLNRQIDRVTNLLNNNLRVNKVSILYLSLFPLIYISYPYYRISGLELLNTIYLLLALAMASVMFFTNFIDEK